MDKVWLIDWVWRAAKAQGPRGLDVIASAVRMPVHRLYAFMRGEVELDAREVGLIVSWLRGKPLAPKLDQGRAREAVVQQQSLLMEDL